MDSITQVTGWTKLFHPAGAQVSLPVPLEPLSGEQARAMFNSVACAANWLLWPTTFRMRICCSTWRPLIC
jgi:hypothetical protein